ncbi:amino acid adenylation domain-containing protein [Natronosporangium hydrolyticum]|uniref:Phenyloxazoline synthase MbtB n=1 Tax=Natronosporangium hydrolyticum TaxID=2811111 RepID=A0A895YHI5_9ACTN|nr:non-ribosomal peptide synthetase [Natronosporangium hydrolyticum]QSB13996.1 amino acid adenylation domain-containing protein [Natronosporangium hydrolyticum]
MTDPVAVGQLDGTFVDVLRANAASDPARNAFRFLSYPGGGETSEAVYTRGELDLRARALAASLAERVKPQDRVLVLLPPGLDFLVGTFGTLYRGAVVVACPPPVDGPSDPRTERAMQIAANAEVSAVVTVEAIRQQLDDVTGQLAGSAPWLTIDTLDPTASDACVAESIPGENLALLQYTSGSTGAPKGVMVSHANLMFQLAQMQQLGQLSSGTNVVSWISPYHALGIAGHLMLSQYLGGEATFLTPEDFIADPARWLRAISATPGPVLSCAPNFAFDRCVDRIPESQRSGLDLAGWHTTMNAAERIRPSTIERFTAAYAPYGFRAEAMTPGFGMTETMLFITARHADPSPTVLHVDAAELERGRAEVLPDSHHRRLSLVGVGLTGPHCEVVVVDPDTHAPVAERQVGEVWVGGPITCQGYWRREQLSDATFRARLADGSGPFVRTGDLGFFFGNELVLCGRHKELIIIRGRNIYPQDVELTSERVHQALAGAPAAAFSIDSEEGEKLIVLQSILDPEAFSDSLTSLATEIRSAITNEHQVEVHEVLVVPPNEVSKTVSGKVQRGACRDRYLAGKVTALAASAMATPIGDVETPTATATLSVVLGSVDNLIRPVIISADLRRRLASMLGVAISEVPEETPLAGLGLESLRAMELRGALERDTGVLIPVSTFLRASVAELAEHISNGFESKEVAPADYPPARHSEAETVSHATAIQSADLEQRYHPFPLTDLQHAYLVGRADGYDLGRVGTHLYLEIDTESLDQERLYAALVELVDRHDMLRAVITDDGEQRVLPMSEATPVPMVVTDVAGSAAEVSTELARIREDMSHEVRPVHEFPLWQVRVSRLSGGAARLHVSIDLLIADVASVRLFFDDWRRLYEGEKLAPLRLTFRDVVQSWLGKRDEEEYQQARSYWLDRIDELPEGPQLPLTRPDGSDRPTWVRRDHSVSPAHWTRIREAAARHQVTPTATMLAAFSVVLARWSRNGRFLLNLPLFSRESLHPDIAAVIGDFTGVTLLEVDLQGNPTLAELAQRLQEQLWQDLAHRDFNGVEVLRELAARRHAQGRAISPVVFASAREQGWDRRGEDYGAFGQQWLGTTRYAISQTPQVVLDHQVYENVGALEFNWDAPAQVLSANHLDNMFDTYCQLLETLVDEAGWGVGVGGLVPVGLGELVSGVNATDGVVPEGLLVDGLVGWGLRDPGRVAVVSADGGVLTFGELVGWASGVARGLREVGVGRGDVVAVGVSKSVEQVVAVVGVLLAGGVYLPVDVDLPVARRGELLSAGGCGWVLCAGGDGDVVWPGGVGVLRVDEVCDREGPVEVSPAVSSDVAYVIFTSGSTGVPKGVAVSHRAALNTCVDVCSRFGVGADDVVLGLSSLSFDLSVWDVFGVLGVGGRLVLPRRGSSRDPGHWLELVSGHGVTVWNSVPALAEMMVAHVESGGGEGGLDSVRLALWSGDWIGLDLPGRWRSVVSGCRVVSLGGATEAGIWSVFYEVGEVGAGWESVPYGRPLAGQRIYVLNDRWEDCPVGVVGELFIGGVGLAEGYWGDVVRSAERFVVHPLSGERLYRTGDLGRWLADGNVEFLGREDSQVKVGGFRIELGEVEVVLGRCVGVSAVVVVAVGGRRGRRLVGFVVPSGSRPAAAAAAGAEDPARQRPPSTGADFGRDRQLLGDVITDPAQRAAITISQPARRTGWTAGVDLPAATDPVRARGQSFRRASYRTFEATPLPMTELSRLLECLRAWPDDERPVPKYRYGSAGSLYPVQTYLYVKPGRVTGLSAGAYYYDPVEHRLYPLRDGETLPADMQIDDNQAAFEGAAFGIYLVGHAATVRPMYGDRSEQFCLLEAGQMSLLLQEAAALGAVGLCGIGLHRNEEPLREAFGLADDDFLLHSLVGGVRASAAPGPGKPDPAQADPSELIAEVRRYASEHLPAYMVPVDLRVMAELPLNAQGKVDRRALAALADEVDRSSAPVVAPGSDLESQIFDVFAAELGTKGMSVTDSFFELGADSVAIVRIGRRLRSALGREVPLMALFEYPSIRRLVGFLDSTGSRPTDRIDEAFDQAQQRRATRRRRHAFPAEQEV